MTDPGMPQRPYKCTCGAAGGDIGELEEHLLTRPDDEEHNPADPAHLTDRVREHQEAARRRHQIRTQLADMLGATADELRKALK